jgi:hypothetical protein
VSDDEDDLDESEDEEQFSATQQTLHAEAVANRDAASLLVLADSLQAQGDPRGELIALMIERERMPSLRLYETEVAYRKQHLNKLLPAFLRKRADSIAWRRGFPFSISIESVEVFERVLATPSLAYVEYVRLHVGDWAEWVEALGGKQLPWRRVYLVLDDESVEIAPLFVAMPALERLDIFFGSDEAIIDWADVEAPRLRSLSFDYTNEIVGLERAELPALEEVAFLGVTPVPQALIGSELWARLKQVVVNADEDYGDGPTIVLTQRADEDDWDEYSPVREDAFIAIGALVDDALVEETARSLTDLRQLVVATGHILGPPAYTVVRLRGSGSTDLAPYGFAVAMERQLAPGTPIVLAHGSERAGPRVFALGAKPMRRSDAPLGVMLRAMFDACTGTDPGPDLLVDLNAALDAARVTTIRGGGGDQIPILVDIDPGTRGQLPDFDWEFDNNIPAEHELELYDPPPDAPKPGTELAETIEAPAIDDVLVEMSAEAAEDEEVAEAFPVVVFDDTDDEDADDNETPEGRDAWMRALAVWADRLDDPDDDLSYMKRWPDPQELIWEYGDFWGIVALVDDHPADSSCHDCEQQHVMLYACAWCGGQHCTSCAIQVEGGAVWCGGCLNVLSYDVSSETDNDDVSLVADEPAVDVALLDDEPEYEDDFA